MIASEKLAYALDCSKRGWAVIPLHTIRNGKCTCGNPKCEAIGKHPRHDYGIIEHGIKDATTDETTIRRWWAKWPKANIGIATGRQSGIVVIDIDPRHGGDEIWRGLQQKYGKVETWQSLTGGGGTHLIFANPPDIEIGNATELGGYKGIDLRGNGGYIVGPGSSHRSGKNYEWELSSSPGDLPLAPMPAWLIKIYRNGTSPEPVVSHNPSWVTKALKGVDEGKRDDTCIKLAGYFRNLHPIDITTSILIDFAAKCRPPLTESTVKKCVNSAYSYANKKKPIPKIVEGLEPEHVKLICSSGWLRSYVDWASAYTDAPLVFHMATGLSLLATAMGNRYNTPAWGRPLYPNLWIVIVSPTGFFRKTTCIRLGMRVLKREMADAILPAEWSRERLVALLAEKPAGLFEWDEFSFALSIMDRDYNSGTRQMLTKLFDSADDHERVTGKGVSGNILNPAPNILGGSTIEWIRSRVKEGDLRGGFLSRFIFIPGIQKESEKDFSLAIRPDIEAELSAWLAKLSRHKDIIVDFSSVKTEIRDWVRKHEKGAESMSPDLIGFLARAETYLLKLSMVLAASENAQRINIDSEILERAILLLDFITQGSVNTFTDIVTSREAQQLDRLREIIKRESPTTQRICLQLSHMKSKTFNELLQTLVETGEVKLEFIRGVGGTQKIVKWQAD